jgi:hypothetical protein
MDARTQLHEARLTRRLTLAELSSRTALSSAVLEKIDAGRFEELPAGVYARSYVRTFALEVGLDPGSTLNTLEALLPVAHDPFPAVQETPAAPPPGARHEQFARCSAAALDALLLLAAVVIPVLWLASWSMGVDLRTLLTSAGGALGAFCALPVLLYFLLFDGIGGGTPGYRIFGLVDPGARAPRTLPEILRRAMLH